MLVVHTERAGAEVLGPLFGFLVGTGSVDLEVAHLMLNRLTLRRRCRRLFDLFQHSKELNLELVWQTGHCTSSHLSHRLFRRILFEQCWVQLARFQRFNPEFLEYVAVDPFPM